MQITRYPTLILYLDNDRLHEYLDDDRDLVTLHTFVVDALERHVLDPLERHDEL